MSKKSGKPANPVKTVWHLSSAEATLAKKPRYNGFACGHGAHGDMKYNRTKSKRNWKRQMRQEGASRGSFPFSSRFQIGDFGYRSTNYEYIPSDTVTLPTSQGQDTLRPLTQ